MARADRAAGGYAVADSSGSGGGSGSGSGDEGSEEEESRRRVCGEVDVGAGGKDEGLSDLE